MRSSEKFNEKITPKVKEFLLPAVILLAFSAFVFAGGPGFILNIPELLRSQICSYQNTTPTCQPSKFRSFDGSCNNKDNPLWGTPYSQFSRLLPAFYSDGVSKFQKSTTGSDLASPRRISKVIFGNQSIPDPEYTIVMMQFGQFIAHDMSYGLEGHAPACCSGSVGQWMHNVPECHAIEIPDSDPAYPSNLTCMNFIRNANTADLACPAVAAGEAVSQISQVTAYLDLSQVYGNFESQAISLRTFTGGRLKATTRDGLEWPPQDPEGQDNCFIDTADETCFLVGDDRANQSPHLTIIQVLYFREHNRLADALASLNPHWSDERIFQEARRVNIAQYQHVSYCEWLKIFLGEENMINKKIIYRVNGSDEYVNDYNASVKSTVFDEHANAAFRFFHTQIEGHLNLVTESRETISTIAMSDHFNNPNITEAHFDDLARGMVYQLSQLTDSNFDTETREFLFKHKEYFGMDLRAIDIQRGRDHGIARYNDFRDFCGLPRATSWNDYLDLIPSSDLENLKLVYASFEDVELSVGAMLENQIDNTTLAGPTLLCILDIQFYVTRVSDRYWFESGDPEVSFSRQQLAEIRKSSFARIFCDNSNNVTTVQPQAFRSVKAGSNDIVSCSEIPVVDLTKWKENE